MNSLRQATSQGGENHPIAICPRQEQLDTDDAHELRFSEVFKTNEYL
jgi:hypothetical protein